MWYQRQMNFGPPDEDQGWDDADKTDSNPLLVADYFDNESYFGCHNSLLDTCPTDSIPLKILQWVKCVILKIARSYYAFPTALILVPFLGGVCIGYMFCRKQTNATNQNKNVNIKFGQTYALRGLWSLASFAMHPTFRFEENKGKDIALQLSKREMRCSSVPESTCTKQRLQLDVAKNEIKIEIEETSELLERESVARANLLEREATGLLPKHNLKVPRHVAVIMDGNRRYGREKYGDATAGHWDGCKKLLEVATWCQAVGIRCLTVYAFSTENWSRDPAEVAALMAFIARYADELRVEALKREIAVRVLSTDYENLIPEHVRKGLARLENDTKIFLQDEDKGGRKLLLNVCLSYGGRGELVQACRILASQCASKQMEVSDITEETFARALLTDEPDLLIRTSGEMRLSNFLLWQLAYAELFFVDKRWPELEMEDFLDILQQYAQGRHRRFGK